MSYKETKLEGAYLIDLELIADQRGFLEGLGVLMNLKGKD